MDGIPQSHHPRQWVTGFVFRSQQQIPVTGVIGFRSDQPAVPDLPGCSRLGQQHRQRARRSVPAAARKFKPCPDCGALNSQCAATCATCGATFSTGFTLTLDEALRTGAIVRGMDLDESEVREAEAMAPIIRQRVWQSGDQKLVQILKVLPDESWARLREILVVGGSSL